MVTDTWEVIDMVVERLEAQSGPLGLNFVGKYGEKLIPSYPAVVVLPGPRAKELHATNTFQIASQLNLFIYHSDLNLTKRERSKADLQLVARIEAELESDYTWTDPDTLEQRVIFGYISNEEPGVLQPRTNKSNLVICTMLTWRALTQRRF